MDNVLLISGLDGTLLNSKGELSEANRQAILSFQAEGGIFTIATSQSEHVLLPLLEKLPLSFPLILHDGALLFDPLEKKHIKNGQIILSSSLLNQLLKLVHGNPISTLFFIGNEVYTTHRDRNIRLLEKRTQCRAKLLEKSTDFSKLIRIVLFSTFAKLLDQIKKAIFHHNIECEAYFTQNDCLEILPLYVNKGRALQEIRQLYNLEHRKTYTIGNNITDFSLFELSDRSYIVKDCHPRLRQKNFIQTVSNDQHAIAHIVQDIQIEPYSLSS